MRRSRKAARNSDAKRVLKDIERERDRQVEKWGVQRHDDARWLMILMEELGEASKDILEKRPTEDIRKELVQCAAVLTAWIEAIDEKPNKVIQIGNKKFHVWYDQPA